MSDDVTSFRIDVPDADLDDLRDRLRRTRWPEAETVDDWSQGVPLGYVQELCRYWADGYDWRATEARLNALPQFRTTIDGLGIHFIHARSPHPDALPLVITHGWPGSIVEFVKVIGPLTDPTAHGGATSDAFHCSTSRSTSTARCRGDRCCSAATNASRTDSREPTIVDGSAGSSY